MNVFLSRLDLGQSNGSEGVTFLCSGREKQMGKAQPLLPHAMKLVCIRSWTPLSQPRLLLTGIE